MLFKNAAEIHRVGVTHLSRDFLNGEVGGRKQLFGLIHPALRYVIHGANTEILVEQIREVARRHAVQSRQVRERQMLRKVRADKLPRFRN